MLKKLLLVGVIVALVPLDRESQQVLYQVARSTLNDLGGFCGRNPDVCARGGKVWEQFTTKAEVAGQLVVDMVKERVAFGDDPLAQIIRQDDEARSFDGGPSPMAGEERLPAYGEPAMGQRQPADRLGEMAHQPRWRGASY